MNDNTILLIKQIHDERCVDCHKGLDFCEICFAIDKVVHDVMMECESCVS